MLNASSVSYKDNDPKGWMGDPSRGAAMGRHSTHGDPDFEYKLLLRKVRLDSGGYDSNGTYFGQGIPSCGLYVYWYASVNHEGEIDVDGTTIEVRGVDATLRANDRDDAKAIILEKYPNARFFR